MKIGCDVDGVLYKWTTSVNQALYQKFGLRGLKEHEYWDYIKVRVTPEQWRWIWNEGVYDVFGRTWNTYPGVHTNVQRWAREHDVHLITHRPRAAAPATYEFAWELQAQILQVKVLEPGVPKSTAGMYDVFIDDRDIVAEDILANTAATFFMPNREWNADFVPHKATAHRFHRYNHLKEVTAWLKTQSST